MSTAIAPPLVIRFGSLGDMVLLTGLLRILHQRCAAPCELVSGTGWPADLLANCPDLGAVHRLASRRRPYWSDPGQWQLVQRLRARDPGPVWVCDDLARPKLRRLLVRAGIPDSRCVWLDPDDGGRRRHWFERLVELACRTPADFTGRLPPAVERPACPPLRVDEASRGELARWREERGLTGPLVLVQPGNKRTQRRAGASRPEHHKWWPPESWRALIAAVLADRRGFSVVLCGSPPEQPLLGEIAGGFEPRRVRACGLELPLPRLMALLEVAHSLIAVDSGPAHIAAALACPSVVLFGAAPVWRWRPLAPPGTAVVTLGGEPDGLDRVDRIAPAAVIAAWNALPGRGAA